MATGIGQRLIGATVLLVSLTVGVPLGAAAQAGSITGKVTDADGGAGLEGARLLITGSNRIETSGREGQYTFRDVAPGTYQLRVLRVGYRPDTGSVAVTAGAAATLDFAMKAAPVQLDEVVSTATGQQRKLEVGERGLDHRRGARSPRLRPSPSSPISFPAAQPACRCSRASGTTGSGTRIRIRGLQQHLALQRAALLSRRHPPRERFDVHDARHRRVQGGPAGNAGPSRINDIDPDDIQDIEIVKGPAAATLYGIQASNGVVRITTKHGTAGPPQWNLFSRARRGRGQQHLSAQLLRSGYDGRRHRRRVRRLLHHSERDRRALHPDFACRPSSR